MKYEIRDQSLAPRCVTSPAPFRQRFSSTRRGARLARLLATQQLADWGWARDSEYLEAAELVVGELAANAVTHGRVPGRDFLLTMTLTPLSEGCSGTLRIEVAARPGGRALPERRTWTRVAPRERARFPVGCHTPVSLG
jgi:hypothetical protein